MPFEKEFTIRTATFNEVGWFFRSASQQDWNGIVPAFIDDTRLELCDGFSVAEYQGEVIGAVATSSKGMDGKSLPTIVNLYVLRKFTKKGVGLRLLVDAMKRLLSPESPKVYCLAITRAMVRTIEKLPQELRDCLEYKVDLSEDFVAAWESLQKIKGIDSCE